MAVTNPLTVSFSSLPCAGQPGAAVLLHCRLPGGRSPEDGGYVCAAAVAIQQGAAWGFGVGVAPRCG